MELALLVYVVNTLSYNGTFFGRLAVICFMFAVALYLIVLSVDYLKALKVVKTFKIPLKEGDVFSLPVDYQDLKAGQKYKVRHYWSHCNELKVEWNSKEYSISDIEGLACRTYEVVDQPPRIKFPSWKPFIYLAIVFTILNSILPTKETMVYSVGAYMVQEVVTSEKAQTVGDAAYRATLRQLDKWAEDSEDLKDLVIDMKKELEEAK